MLEVLSKGMGRGYTTARSALCAANKGFARTSIIGIVLKIMDILMESEMEYVFRWKRGGTPLEELRSDSEARRS